MKDIEKVLEKASREEFEVPQKVHYRVQNTLKNKTKNKNHYFLKVLQSVITAIMCGLSLTGMVFAKEISTTIYNKYLTGNGIESAINNGYVEKIEMENQASISTIKNKEKGTTIEGKETKIKVSELVMDNYSLSMTFEVILSDEIKEIITAEEIKEMKFSDLVVYDENNLILYALDDSIINKFSEKNNITVDKALGSGVNSFISGNEGNTVKVIYNFHLGGDAEFPKCKEIHIDLNQIRISRNPECATGDEEITIEGAWNFKIDVPEKMYNRESVQYIQKSTTNKDFNVESAVLYNTGMEIKIKMKAENYISDEEMYSGLSEELKFFWSLDKSDELKNTDILNYLSRKNRENPKYQELTTKRLKQWQFEKYLTNSNGERFEFTVGPRANGEASIVDGIITSTCMFDLTQYDATNQVTLHLEYNGKEADIVLEKVDK